MSNKERVIQLIDDIPDYKLMYVVDMLSSIKSLLVQEIEPDEWDLPMIADAKKIMMERPSHLRKCLKRMV